jgi:arylsulfatase A-like enzyme
MSWPARIPAGQVVDVPAATMDALPTLLMAAAGDPSAYDLDGVDLLPVLMGPCGPIERELSRTGTTTHPNA